MMRQTRQRKLIQPESGKKKHVGGGRRQTREGLEEEEGKKEKEKGPLAVALSGTIWHLTTDAHELNKLSFPFLCQFPRFPSSFY